jgi:hypothetical protein
LFQNMQSMRGSVMMPSMHVAINLSIANLKGAI